MTILLLSEAFSHLKFTKMPDSYTHLPYSAGRKTLVPFSTPPACLQSLNSRLLWLLTLGTCGR